MLAETGRVNHACDCVGLSKQSAYALRSRDPLFAAGWDAAAELARDALADQLLERAVHGYSEVITRGGEVIAERHKYDGRLSMAVLNRLDRRCDRTAAERVPHALAKADWQAFLDAVGQGDDTAATAILHPPQNAEVSQPGQADGDDAPVWQDELTGEWHTSFRHPDWPDEEVGPAEGRPCTDEEAELLTDYFGDEHAAVAAAENASREIWFADLRAGLAERDCPGGLPLKPEPRTFGTGCGTAPRRSSFSTAKETEMTQRDPHPDNNLIDEMEDESLGAGAQQGRSGGNLARDVSTRDELKTADGFSPEPTSVNKSDKPDDGASANPPDGTDLGGS